jgi:phage major head subunit gpT-like protein
MFTEQQNLAIARTELDTVFYQEFQYDAAEPGTATAKTGEIFKPLTTEHAQYIEEVFKGSPLFPVIGETQTVPLSTPRVANKLTVSIKDFAQGVEISKDLFDDNLHGVWSRTVRDLALKARVSQDQNAFAFWNGAFTTSLTADGAALCATHTLINGQTYSNALGAVALTEPNLNTAIINLRTQPDQSNVILGNVPSYLLVPPALFKTAIQITDSALIPGKGDNDINVYRSAYGITVYSSPYLAASAGGSDTAWFLLARNHAVTRLVRQGIETSLRSWEMSNNRTYFYQANFREVVYSPDYIGVVGATGA